MKQHQVRRLQIFSVALGTTSFLISLIGGTLRNPLLAQLGAVGFLLALLAVIALGAFAWRRFG